jgi:hypothetical protein
MRIELTNAHRRNVYNPLAFGAMEVLARRARNEVTSNVVQLATKLGHFGSQLSVFRFKFVDTIGVAHKVCFSI